MNWTWWRGYGQTSLMKWAEGCILTIRWNSACVTALPLAIRQDTIPKPSNQTHNPSLIAWELAHANTGGNREVMSTKGWEQSLQWIREYSAWNLWKHIAAQFRFPIYFMTDPISQPISLQLLNTIQHKQKKSCLITLERQFLSKNFGLEKLDMEGKMSDQPSSITTWKMSSMSSKWCKRSFSPARSCSDTD
jgi:hypothetical protein